MSEKEILVAVEGLRAELIEFTARLIATPSINPPGENYELCAELIAGALRSFGFETKILDHHNVIGTWPGASPRPMLHFNGHMDVVPPGESWTRDPFLPFIHQNRIYGRGSSDMKAGLAAAIYAAAALRRAGVPLRGSLQISATVDEESGGFAGVAHLARQGLLTSSHIDYVIIPEPFGPARICIGHRGVYWFRIVSHGRMAHGAMPFLGVSAIENMARLIEELRNTVGARLRQRRTEMPVVPEESRFGTLNANSIHGGQPSDAPQTPCVADRCEAVFDRRYLVEDGELQNVKSEIQAAIDRVDGRFDLHDYGNSVRPVATPRDCKLVRVLSNAVRDALEKEPELVASPGTYDHKHFTHIGNIVQCVAYGPGDLAQAHQPDEWCDLDDLVDSCKVMALTAARLLT